MGAYQVIARNFSQATENKIHDDEIARQYGFEGALVPGVAVYGHLTHPLVEKFGEAWLSHSLGSVRFLKPAYHGDRLDISHVEDAAGHHARCHNQHGVLLAELHCTMPEALPEIEDQAIFAN
ncbi:MAG: MaoC family dehydratase, partial [Gammaproteobacteria bacterium]|nr:MaoC family dehydratase [Gammaproteobacteria bacterium]